MTHQPVTIFIDCEPIAWSAPRVCKKITYDIRKKNKDYFKIQVMSKYRGSCIDGPVKLDFTFQIKLPPHTSIKRQREMIENLIVPAKRPDITNYIKLYEDILKGIVIKDDSQVVEIHARKLYHVLPGVLIQIEPIYRNLK